ncbi:MAG: DNA repair protein RecO [Pelolinea sp.]|nr:DNA repair protein RecO [Pelolinea sp.]
MRAFNRLQKVEAIIITHRDYGEADRLLRAYTSEKGKITILAKGAKKAGSRKAPHVEPFSHCKLMIAKGQSFWILTQADTIEYFARIHQDLNKTALAAYLLEIVDRLSAEEQPDSLMFRMLATALKQIDRAEDAYNAATYFELHLLDEAGFRPDLFHCVSCGKEIVKEDQYFSTSQGGVVCPSCGVLQDNLLPASQGSLRFLRHFQRSSYDEVKDIYITPAIRKEIRKILDSFVSSLSERKLNTPAFIQHIKRLTDKR